MRDWDYTPDMKIPWCPVCLLRSFILTSSIALSWFPLVTQAADEANAAGAIPGEATPAAPLPLASSDVKSAGERERVAALEARVEKLEQEVLRLRTAVQSAASTLAAAAGSDEKKKIPPPPVVLDENAGVKSSGSTPSLMTEFDREQFLSLSDEGRANYLNELRMRSEELRTMTAEGRAKVYKEILNRVVASDPGRKPDNSSSNTRGNDGNSKAASTTPKSAGTPSASESRNFFNSLSDESRREFLEEMRSIGERLYDASQEERAKAVADLMDRLRAKEAARKQGGAPQGNDNGNSSSATSLNPGGGREIKISGSAPAPMPEVPKTQQPPLPQPESSPRPKSAGPSEDTRARFNALTEKQREIFFRDMRESREQMRYASPEERQVMMEQLIKKAEQEGKKAEDAPATSPAKPEPTSPATAEGEKAEKKK
ncbi:hypothetical protein DES53_11521 [Roseimicrobium gellanilyticum]|uniref:Uncharacterized protein n=2 Tax=Roseimicrobium gellanilyticum TaxID=748857 RepID=A0A366H7B7_9BACT|nr:hypothetical protein DES53_11521 [Roseimicrobium gellanilyticum]